MKLGMVKAHSHASLQAVSWGFHYSEKPGLTDKGIDPV